MDNKCLNKSRYKDQENILKEEGSKTHVSFVSFPHVISKKITKKSASLLPMYTNHPTCNRKSAASIITIPYQTYYTWEALENVKG